MRMKYKPWALPYLREHADVVFHEERLDQADFQNFIHHRSIHLEIGGGKGDFVVQLAALNPHKRFLMIEKNISAAGFASKKIVESGLTNLKMICADVVDCFAFIPDQTFATIFLNFSDPWPKKRHTKRRLTYNQTLIDYARMLKDSGFLKMKTDNDDLFAYSLETIAESGWKIGSIDYHYDGKDPFDAMSEYERNFRLQSIPIKRVVAKKGRLHDFNKTSN